MNLIHNMCSEITILKSLPYLSWTNELKYKIKVQYVALCLERNNDLYRFIDFVLRYDLFPILVNI